jgi:hypothetical protein
MAGNTIFITATEARQNALKDLVVHSEARDIEDAILNAVQLGYYDTLVSNSTIMTSSSSNTFVVSNTNVSVTSSTFFIPNHGLGNGSVVTVNDSGALPTPLTANTYYYVIYSDAGNIKLATSYADAVNSIPKNIQLSNSGNGNVFVTTYSASRDYWAVWQGQTPSNPSLTGPYLDQMNIVSNYFTNMGYNIIQQTNINTGNTMQWVVKW